MRNLTPETAYALAGLANLVFLTIGWLIGRRGKKVKK